MPTSLSTNVSNRNLEEYWMQRGRDPSLRKPHRGGASPMGDRENCQILLAGMRCGLCRSKMAGSHNKKSGPPDWGQSALCYLLYIGRVAYFLLLTCFFAGAAGLALGVVDTTALGAAFSTFSSSTVKMSVE